jgi:hypothetical protein
VVGRLGAVRPLPVGTVDSGSVVSAAFLVETAAVEVEAAALVVSGLVVSGLVVSGLVVSRTRVSVDAPTCAVSTSPVTQRKTALVVIALAALEKCISLTLPSPTDQGVSVGDDVSVNLNRSARR